MYAHFKKIFIVISLMFCFVCLGSKAQKSDTPKDVKTKQEKPYIPKTYVKNERYNRKYAAKLNDKILKPEKGLVLTLRDYPANEQYRKFTYDLIEQYAQARESKLRGNIKLADKAGYDLTNPGLVVLINKDKKGYNNNEAGFFKGYGAIVFREKKENKKKFGNTRLTFLHEITHLSERHYRDSGSGKNKKERRAFSQEQETIADAGAVIVGQCYRCAQEEIDNFFEDFKKDKIENYRLLKKKSLRGMEAAIKNLTDENEEILQRLHDEFDELQKLSRELVEKMSDKEFNEKYEYLNKASSLLYETHPLDIARAFTIIKGLKTGKYRVSLQDRCKYHQQFDGAFTTKQMFSMIKEAEQEAQKKDVEAAHEAERVKQLIKADNANPIDKAMLNPSPEVQKSYIEKQIDK
jgi:hypothetical protein